MLFLQFEIDSDRYALDVHDVVEVLPMVRMTEIPSPSPGVAGIFNYRGAATPAVDLSQLVRGRAASARLSTRLVVVRSADADGRQRSLGLIAERATQTMRRPRTDFGVSGVTSDRMSCVSEVATDERGLVQLVDVSKLLAQSMHPGVIGRGAER